MGMACLGHTAISLDPNHHVFALVIDTACDRALWLETLTGLSGMCGKISQILTLTQLTPAEL